MIHSHISVNLLIFYSNRKFIVFVLPQEKKLLFFSHSSGWEQKEKRQNRYRVHMRAVIAHIIVLCASYSHLYFLFYPQMDYRWIFECCGKNLLFAINLRNNFNNSADPWDGFLGRGAVWIFFIEFQFSEVSTDNFEGKRSILSKGHYSELKKLPIRYGVWPYKLAIWT